ncbi:class I SAM-dependent methyltransferase [Mesorhizobium sp. B2-7-1]|uniref:N5-glutamine methyltransferase family protein n=1 Tax=Mesorhizobium sp. B2-7-1 TaxID=2589909 RepID=UPI001128B5D0|nr:class I SAM-dependent methyltransferase [Mesorhizobium sp. B2-7-1]TPJ70636.1 class I SAM-dependent methyltransferase [Mesorhizobium sp. B2-7-1]
MSEDIDVAEAYGRGNAVFMGMEMLVACGALVPRPETELLGSTAVNVLHEMKLPTPRVVDMCCGAGNLACAIAHHVPTARVWASDLTDGCVAVARRNVVHHGLADRVSIHQGDLFEALATPVSPGSIDVVVCNPPYISEKRLQGDRSHLVTLEPREAFAAGPYGIAIHLRVVKDALRYLRPGGALLFEVGLGQDRQVASLFERSRSYEGIRGIINRAGEARVVLGYTKSQH